MTKKPYDDWRGEVETLIIAEIGIDSDGIPDYRYRLDYEEGKTPKQTAKRAIKAAKDF